MIHNIWTSIISKGLTGCLISSLCVHTCLGITGQKVDLSVRFVCVAFSINRFSGKMSFVYLNGSFAGMWTISVSNKKPGSQRKHGHIQRNRCVTVVGKKSKKKSTLYYQMSSSPSDSSGNLGGLQSKPENTRYDHPHCPVSSTRVSLWLGAPMEIQMWMVVFFHC